MSERSNYIETQHRLIANLFAALHDEQPRPSSREAVDAFCFMIVGWCLNQADPHASVKELTDRIINTVERGESRTQ